MYKFNFQIGLSPYHGGRACVCVSFKNAESYANYWPLVMGVLIKPGEWHHPQIITFGD